jgi:hypothetical protein
MFHRALVEEDPVEIKSKWFRRRQKRGRSILSVKTCRGMPILTLEKDHCRIQYGKNKESFVS